MVGSKPNSSVPPVERAGTAAAALRAVTRIQAAGGFLFLLLQPEDGGCVTGSIGRNAVTGQWAKQKEQGGFCHADEELCTV
ncbi:MAG TPA: hypothetical protein VEQ16_05095 [Acidocella sp.]|nr:hypothetical protein [Acidocella sp.]